ncbi:MAG TPA: UbiD family decarboxylase [Alphaproteobacteria bacterium]|nr:UbiD family decarboxylase [Alphaproteobacteria bacterium]
MRRTIEELVRQGDVRVVEREVDPRFELAAVVAASQRQSEAALLFRAITGSALPAASNLYGSYTRLCQMIGTEDGNFVQRWSALSDAFEAKPIEPSIGLADPGDLVDLRLSDLPAVTYHEKDAGPYITAGIVLARHPESSTANLSFHRAMQVSDTELRIRIGESHDLAGLMAAAEAQGEALEVAMLIGTAPEIFLAACASLPPEADEISAAAMVRGEAVPLRPCAHIGLAVPADTEIVIEGRLLPGLRRPEGPFGEFMGYYVPGGSNQVLEISGISARRDPTYHALLCGSPEDMRPLETAIAARIYRHLVRAGLPGIIDVSCRPRLLNTVVKIDKQSADHPREVIMAAFDAHPDYSKAVVVVDQDIDITDMNEAWWAYLTRGRADTRAFVIEDRPGFYRDPKGDHKGRLGIDATMPLDRKFEFELKRVPGAEAINLRDYLK